MSESSFGNSAGEATPNTPVAGSRLAFMPRFVVCIPSDTFPEIVTLGLNEPARAPVLRPDDILELSAVVRPIDDQVPIRIESGVATALGKQNPPVPNVRRSHFPTLARESLDLCRVESAPGYTVRRRKRRVIAKERRNPSNTSVHEEATPNNPEVTSSNVFSY